MKEKDCVIKLISDYRNLVDEMLILLKKNVKEGIINLGNSDERIGILESKNYENITYEMHGLGCWFQINNRIIVDVDYAKPRYDGIDYWFLASYFNSCSEKYSEIRDKDHLEEIMENMVNAEYLIKHDYLYYIRSEFDKPKVFDWGY